MDRGTWTIDSCFHVFSQLRRIPALSQTAIVHLKLIIIEQLSMRKKSQHVERHSYGCTNNKWNVLHER